MGKRKKDLSEFGEFLVAEICKTGMSKDDFCTAVGINKPYFYESLAGTPPSQEILEKMLEVLDGQRPSAALWVLCSHVMVSFLCYRYLAAPR